MTTSASLPPPEGSGFRPPLKPRIAADDHFHMRELEESVPDEVLEEELIAFAAFALTHAACCDVVEVRIGERCIVEWCPSCQAIRTFVSPGG